MIKPLLRSTIYMVIVTITITLILLQLNPVEVEDVDFFVLGILISLNNFAAYFVYFSGEE